MAHKLSMRDRTNIPTNGNLDTGNGKTNNPTFSTVRFDIATRLAILTGLVYSGMDTSLEQAMETAVKINDMADTRAKELKKAS